MNRQIVIMSLLGVLAGIVVGASSVYVLKHDRTDSPAALDDGAEASRTVLYWHDPMVPGTKFDKPGKSPFMDMQLVPVYADESNDGRVHIAAAVAQNLGVRTGMVDRRAFVPSLTAVGGVAFDERHIVVVQSRVSGTVTRLHVKAPLEMVEQGQPLADILSPEWLAAQQEYIALLDVTSAAAREIRDATRERLRVLGVPESAISLIEKTRQVSATTTIYAPIGGTIAELSVREGSSFTGPGALLQINSLATVWVNAQIPESQVGLVPVGSTAKVSATAWPSESFDGQVISLLPTINEQTRTLTARIEVQNKAHRLVPGMFVALKFERPSNVLQLVVPSEAVIMTGQRSAVIVAEDEGKYRVADVQVGGESDGLTAVLSGLNEGDRVVRSGQFLIDSEASLRSTVNRLEAMEETQATSEPANAADDPTHFTSGIITVITPDEVTLSHAPVASLHWPAMTMAFKKPQTGVPPDFRVGDQVNFSFRKEEGGYRLHSISKADTRKSDTERNP
jgi:Cu(I)/Ag(I) efflux system membrane fusion protein